MKRIQLLVLLSLLILLFPCRVNSCTSVVVSKSASKDGSVMTSWTYDVAGYMSPLHFYTGGTYKQGDSLDILGFRDKKFLGRIAQIPKTNKIVGNMNEYQVSISETTFGGRKELHDGPGILDYGNLIYITLQRAKTAREAILIIDELAKKYGYIDSGETFSIADKNEVWIMDFIGKGKHGKGAVWVAARVPEGYMAAHANQSRIRQIDWKDKENWMWADDVVDFAKEMGWFKGKKKDFSFADTYNPLTPTALLLCESRVWSIYRRAAPSQNFSADYWRCIVGAEPYPLFIKPDRKLGIEDMIAFHRDHFHDTPYFTGEGIAAGPYKNPYRWRPVVFEMENDTMKYSWERPISQPQTAFSYITQARSSYPNSIGGICWYSVDDTYSNAWMPLYLGLNKVPPSIASGSPVEFDWNSAYWVFSLVSNFAYGMYNQMMPDIQKVQIEIENRALNMIPAIDKAALALIESNPEFIDEYLTNFSYNNVEYTTERWKNLASYLLVKYNDGYKREEMKIDSWPKSIGYPEDFRQRAIDERPGYYELRWRENGESVE